MTELAIGINLAVAVLNFINYAKYGFISSMLLGMSTLILAVVLFLGC